MGIPAQYAKDVPSGFAAGIRVETLQSDLHVSRYYGGKAQPQGRWVTATPAANPLKDLALDASNNTATSVAEWVIPRGTKVIQGPVAPLNGQPGGATQIYLPDPSVLRKP